MEDVGQFRGGQDVLGRNPVFLFLVWVMQSCLGRAARRGRISGEITAFERKLKSHHDSADSTGVFFLWSRLLVGFFILGSFIFYMY